LRIKIVIVLLVIASTFGIVHGAGSDWFTFKGNYMRTSSTSMFVEPPVLKVAWQQNLKSSISSSPIIFNNDCFISTEGDGKGSLYSLSAGDGTVQWVFPTSPSISNWLSQYEELQDDKRVKPWPNGAIDFPKAKLTIPITADNKLYVPWGQNLLVLNKDSGKLLNRFNLAPHSASITTSPVVSEYFQIIVVGASNGWLYGFDIQNRDPMIRWRLPDPVGTGDFIRSSPAFVGTNLYFGSNSKYFYCLDLEKPPNDKSKGVQQKEKPSMKWSIKLDSAVVSSPAVSSGRIYVTTEAGMLYAISERDGSILWKYDTVDKKIDSSPAVARGYVVFAAERTLYCVSESSGEYVWSTNSKKNISSTPLIGGDYVYYTSMDGKMSVVKLSTGASVSAKSIDMPIKSSPAVALGKVFFGTDDGIFYALEKGDAAPELGIETKEINVPALSINKTITKEVDVQNKGGGTLEVAMKSSRAWIKVEPSDFTLGPGEFKVVRVTIDATGQQANLYKSLIKVTSNGGNSSIGVNVNVIKNPDKIISMTIGNKTAYLNGEPILLGVAPWKSPPPAITTMVPIRFVEDTFGCTVSWNASQKRASIEYEKRKVKISFTIGQKACVFQIGNSNPQLLYMYYPATIKENRTCVSIDFMAHVFDARIEVDPANTSKVTVIIPGD
jgi:outer membrane protein assembly factor BamB